MGILARITDGIKGDKAAAKLTDGGHAISKDKVLKPTDSTVINPLNPGNFSSIRTAPVVPDPRYFKKEEADALKKLATEKADGARQAKRAYKSLGKIEEADATVHKSHRKYEGTVADNELTKLRSNARLGKKLHAQRADYFRLGAGLERADKSAQTRIDELKNRAKEHY